MVAACSDLRSGELVQGGGRKLCLCPAGAAPWEGVPGSDGIQPWKWAPGVRSIWGTPTLAGKRMFLERSLWKMTPSLEQFIYNLKKIYRRLLRNCHLTSSVASRAMHFPLYKLQVTVTRFSGRKLGRYKMLPESFKGEEKSQHIESPPSKPSLPSLQSSMGGRSD